jgi:hypothetical protein
MVILHPVNFDAGLFKGTPAVHFGKETTVVAKPSGFNQFDVRNL